MATKTKTYKPKSKGFAHQSRELSRTWDKKAFAHLWEMGTGKSWIGVNTAGALKHADKIDLVLIGCPNGLQRNWLKEFERHCGVPYKAAVMEGKMRASEKRVLQELIDTPSSKLKVIAFNIEALRFGDSFDQLESFVKGRRFLMILDESQRIKGWKKSLQTMGAIALGKLATFKRIMSGTASPQSPVDLFSQFYFLDPRILGFTSISAFRSHYCEILGQDENGQWIGKDDQGKYLGPPIIRAMADKAGQDPTFVARRMQLIARSPDGRPRYKNLDDLAARIKPYSSRILKADCLDLPPKLYADKIEVTLSKKQRNIYDEVRRHVIAEFVHDQRLWMIDSQLAITKLARLAMINGNHFPATEAMSGSGSFNYLQFAKKTMRIEEPKDNPRMIATQELVEDAGDSSVMIFSWHTDEIDELCEVFPDALRIDGTVPAKDRFAISQRFCNRDKGCRLLIAQCGTAIGWDGYAASVVLFYMNDFSLEHRLQAEDRAHRIGLTHAVTYKDIVARNTLDDKIIDALRAKREVMEIIMGDPLTQWI